MKLTILYLHDSPSSSPAAKPKTPDYVQDTQNLENINKISTTYETAKALKRWGVIITPRSDGQLALEKGVALRHIQTWKASLPNWSELPGVDEWNLILEKWDKLKLISNGVDSAVFQWTNKNGESIWTLIIETSKFTLQDGTIAYPKDLKLD
jgi:hypothetical protein